MSHFAKTPSLRAAKSFIKSCSLILLLFEVPSAGATEIRQFGESHGLPDSRIHSITQTFDGFLWLATPSGLTSFDGQRWKHHDRQSHTTLADESILSLAADRLGYLWVGTEHGGLHRFDGLRFRPVSRPNQVGGPWAATVLHQELDSTLWIGTPNDLLYLQPTASASLHGLPGIKVNDLTQDLHGFVWASAGRGLFRQVHKTFQAITLPLGLEGAVTQAIVMLPDGRLATGREDGLIFFNGDYATAGLPQTFEFEEAFRGRSVRRLLVDHQGLLVVATDHELNRQLRDGSFQTLFNTAAEASLPEAQQATVITSLFEDREGSLWVGTAGGGLFQVPKPTSTPSLAAQVTRFEIDGKSAPAKPSLLLPPTMEEVGLLLAAPTFISDTEPKLRYRLEGHHEDWQETEDGWARFRGLAPGSYRFRAEVSSDGNAWIGATEVTLTRQPKLHQKRAFWFATLGSIGSVLLGVFGWITFHRRRAMALAKQRAEEWREIQEESGLMDSAQSIPDNWS